TFSRNIKIRSASFIIKYFGILATSLGFLTVVPALHYIIVTISSILPLVIFFYITVIVLKSKLNFLKVISVLFLLTFYFATYMYFTRSYLAYIPIMQKVILLMKIVWILVLEYRTSKEDFEYIIK
ncbi:MAG: hypothetical protein ACJA01_004362, partial [Saprospiraceae bacterium]